MDVPLPHRPHVDAVSTLLSLPEELLDKILFNVAYGGSARATAALLSVCKRFWATLRAASAVRPTRACVPLHQASEHNPKFQPLHLQDCLALDAVKLAFHGDSEKPVSVSGAFATRPGAGEELPLLAVTRLEAFPFLTVPPNERARLGLPANSSFVASLLAWQHCTQLRYLHVYGDTATRADMVALGNLRNLRELSLTGQICGLSSPYVHHAVSYADNVQPLGKLAHLESLCLDVPTRHFTWMHHITPLTRLTRLHVCLRKRWFDQDVPGVISELPLSGLAALCDVRLCDAYWHDEAVAVLASLPALARLDLSRGLGLEPSVLEPLAAAPALRNLSLRSCALSDDCVAPLARLSALLSLDLAENTALTDDSLSRLGELTALTALGLEKNDKLAHLPLAGWSALERLDAHASGIPPAAVLALGRPSSLRMLGIGAVARSRGGDPAAAQLSRLSSLQHVQLHVFLDLETGAAALALLPQLRSIRVSGTGIGQVAQTRGLSHSAKCSRLERITLQQLPWGAEAPALAHLAAVPALQQLFVTEGVRPRLVAEAFAGSKNLRLLGEVAPKSEIFHELACLGAIQPLRQVVLESDTIRRCAKCAAVMGWLSASDVQLVPLHDFSELELPLLAIGRA